MFFNITAELKKINNSFNPIVYFDDTSTTPTLIHRSSRSMITKINIISSNFFHRHIISDNVWMHGVAAERGREKNNKWFFRSLSQKSGVQIEKKNRMKICQYLYELELTSAISPLPFFALLSVDATQYTQNIKTHPQKIYLMLWFYQAK